MSPDPLARHDLRARVQQVLDATLARLEPTVVEVDDACAGLMDAVRDLVDGGKRLRAGFCYWGWRGTGSDDDDLPVQAGAALELFQAAALLHDDVIDDSDIRRGRPAVHRSFEALHRDSGWTGDATRFGQGVAILAGDLCLAWSAQLLAQAAAPLPSPRRDAARAVYDLMATQLMSGQFFDMVCGARPPASDPVAAARRVIRFKTVQYTVEHPLRLGGTLAGAKPALLEQYSAYARAVGEAFQLRDDLLGVFGDPALTGKPAGDDLREGKQTVLLALARRGADPGQASALERVGDPTLDPAGIDDLRAVIAATGAVDEVEDLISGLERQALDVLDASSIVEPARSVLADLAHTAARRSA